MKIFIGYDSREDIAFQVCRESLARNSSVYLNIHPIKQDELRKQKLYWRGKDPLASTEFTYTRFLTPYLAGYKGWAVFMDCDFLWRGDIATVMDYADHSCSVMVVKHNYQPKETTKMDGCVQTQYPLKNWSSSSCLHVVWCQPLRGLISRSRRASAKFSGSFTQSVGDLPCRSLSFFSSSFFR